MMLSLASPRWETLRHAYGAASDIPALLAGAAADTRSAADPGSAWFALWSALCHQGDAYSASLAAVPHLIVLAADRPVEAQFEPVVLAGSIEQARLEGRAPTLPEEFDEAYRAAMNQGAQLAAAALAYTTDPELRQGFAGSLAAFRGDLSSAQAIFDVDEG